MSKIKIGDRVKVTNPDYDAMDYGDKTGTVLRDSPGAGNYLVEFDDDWGAVWFSPEELEALP